MLSSARCRIRLRAALVASSIGIALATVLAVLGAYSRAPNGLLGIAFARAYAAESAATERTKPRLRIDDEDERLEDTDAVLPSVEAAKTATARARAEAPGARRAAECADRLPVPTTARLDSSPGIERVPIGTPTRERARLMVFLI